MNIFLSLRLLSLSIVLVKAGANFPLIDPCLQTCNDEVELEKQQTCDLEQEIPRFLFAGQSNMVRLQYIQTYLILAVTYFCYGNLSILDFICFAPFSLGGLA